MKRRNAKRHPSKTKNTRKHEMTKTRKKDKKALAKCEKQARKDETTEGTEIIEIGEADSLRSSSDSSLLKKLRFASSFPLCIQCWSRFAQPTLCVGSRFAQPTLCVGSRFAQPMLRITQWFIFYRSFNNFASFH